MHATTIRGVRDAKLFPLTTDAGTLTYGAAVDIPGISEVTLTPNFDTSTVNGDDVEYATSSRLAGIGVKMTNAALSLDVLNKMLGSAIVDSGTTPNQLATMTLAAADSIPYWKLAFQVAQVQTGAAAVTFTLYKVIITDWGVGGKYGDFSEPDISGRAVYTIFAPSKLADIQFQETLVAIA